MLATLHQPNMLKAAIAKLAERSSRVALALGIIAIASAADLVLTLSEMSSRGMFESNPLVRMLAASASPLLSIVVLKVSSVVVATVIFWRLRLNGRAEIGLWVSTMVLIGLMVRWAMYLHAVSNVDIAQVQFASCELTIIG